MSGLEKPNFFTNQDGSNDILPFEDLNIESTAKKQPNAHNDIFSSMSKFSLTIPQPVTTNESKTTTPSFGFGSSKKKNKKTSFLTDAVPMITSQSTVIDVNSEHFYKYPIINSKQPYQYGNEYYFRDTELLTARDIDKIIEENNALEAIGDAFGVEVKLNALPSSHFSEKNKGELTELVNSLIVKTLVEKKLKDGKSSTYLFSDIVKDLINIMRRMSDEDRGELINRLIFDCILPKSKMEASSSDPARKQFSKIIEQINAVTLTSIIGIRSKDNINRIVDYFTKSNYTSSYRNTLTPSSGVKNIILFLSSVVSNKLAVTFPSNFREVTNSGAVISLLSKPTIDDLESFYKKKEKVVSSTKTVSKKSVYDDYIDDEYDDYYGR